MHQLRADLNGFVEHLLNTVSNLRRLRVRHVDQDLEELKRVPRMTLHIGSERLDGRAGDRDIIDCDLQEAITRWLHTVDHGSNLAFWEEKDGGNPVYCRAGGRTEWNYALDVDTLEIEYDPTWEETAASHVGYEDPIGK